MCADGFRKLLDEEQLDKILKDMVLNDVDKLASGGMIKMESDGVSFQPTDLGRLMARYGKHANAVGLVTRSLLLFKISSSRPQSFSPPSTPELL